MAAISAVPPARPDPVAGLRLGPYRLLQEIGSGGMGTVYLGRRDDGVFTKDVAIKIARLSLANEDRNRRFRNERQILAQLEHPGIARLLDGGTTERGEPYLVMEHVDGRPIDVHCREHELTVEERLRLVAAICDAVDHAHSLGVVHRDLKPPNILVTSAGEPRLLDFGIAKLLDKEGFPATVEATSGNFMMTPHYASPEQIRGEAVTAASDIYSLGVLLYQLLTGRLPFKLRWPSAFDLQRTVLKTDPPRPSRAAAESLPEKARQRGLDPNELSRRLAGELDRIVLRAMHKEPSRRYASAADLANDLRHHLAGEPVAARGDPFFYRAASRLRQHGVTLAFTALLVVVFAVVVHSSALRPEAQDIAMDAQVGSAPTILGGAPLPPALSSDASARQFYEDGVRALQQRDGELARRHFQAALDADEDFVLARVALSEAYSALGRDRDATLGAAAAYEELAPLPRRHQLWVEARYHETASRWDDAAVAYQALWTFYPDDIEYGLRLGFVQVYGESYDDALKTVDKLRELPADPRVDLLEAKAAFYLDDLERSAAAAGRTVTWARSHRSTALIADGLLTYGWALMRQGELDIAAAAFTEGSDIYETLGDDSQLARMLNGLAGVHWQRCRYQEALETYRRGLEVQRRLGARRHIAALQMNIASLLFEMGDISAGMERVRNAGEIYHDLGLRGGEGAVMIAEGAIALLRGDVNTSERLLNEALVLHEPLGARLQTAFIHRNLSRVALTRGQHAEAQAHLTELARVCEELKHPILCFERHLHEAWLHRLAGELSAADEAYVNARDLAAQNGQPTGVAKAETERAWLALARGDAGEAVRLTDLAIPVLHERGLKDSAALAVAARLEAFTALGRDGRELAERLKARLEVTEDAELRFRSGIALARHLAASDDVEVARSLIDGVVREAGAAGFVEMENEARRASEEISG